VPVGGPTVHLLSEQGAEIGRPSLLTIEVDTAGGDASTVRVGGQVVPMAEGAVSFGCISILG
jgi:predicted PhzF superfamily epimerase YddE/YHI9